MRHLAVWLTPRAVLLPATLFSGDDLSHRTPVATLPAEVSTPVCEGSLVADRGVLYFSHPQSETTRTNLTIHRSEDNGTIESCFGERVFALILLRQAV